MLMKECCSTDGHGWQSQYASLYVPRYGNGGYLRHARLGGGRGGLGVRGGGGGEAARYRRLADWYSSPGSRDSRTSPARQHQHWLVAGNKQVP